MQGGGKGSKGAGPFAGMDPKLAAEAEKMWKQLDDMSTSDPAAYKKFISEQMQMGAAEGLLPPTADMPAPGRRVRVHGLVKMAEYNGREGVVKSVLGNGRMCVLLAPGKEVVPSPSKELSLKATNLEVIPPTAGHGGNNTGTGRDRNEEIAVKPAEDDEESIRELALPSNAPARQSGAGPLIQEVSGTVNTMLPNAAHSVKYPAPLANGEQQMIITVECPHAATVGDIDVQVADREIFVDAEGQQPLQLPLERAVDVDSLSAKFNKKRRLLTLAIRLAQ